MSSWSLVATALIPTRIHVRSHTAKSGLLVKDWGKQHVNISNTTLYCIRQVQAGTVFFYNSAPSSQPCFLMWLSKVTIEWSNFFFTPMTSFDEHIPPCFKRHIFNVCTHPLGMQQLYFDCIFTAFLLHFCKPMGSTLWLHYAKYLVHHCMKWLLALCIFCIDWFDTFIIGVSQ